MAVKPVLAVLGVLMLSSSGVLAQQATSADTPDPSAMRLVARATPRKLFYILILDLRLKRSIWQRTPINQAVTILRWMM